MNSKSSQHQAGLRMSRHDYTRLLHAYKSELSSVSSQDTCRPCSTCPWGRRVGSPLTRLNVVASHEPDEIVLRLLQALHAPSPALHSNFGAPPGASEASDRARAEPIKARFGNTAPTHGTTHPHHHHHRPHHRHDRYHSSPPPPPPALNHHKCNSVLPETSYVRPNVLSL